MKTVVAILGGWALVAPSFGSLLATADMTYTQLNATTYEYAITLHDTGTTNVGTLWYSWIPGRDFMPVTPTNIQHPANWSNLVFGGGFSDGYSIQWTTSSAALTAGQSLPGFKFDSTATPTQIGGFSNFGPYAVNTSYVYIGGPELDPGRLFTVQLTPEPATLALVVIGSAWAMRRRRPI